MDSDRDGREAKLSRKRTASTMMLQEAAYSRRQNSSSTRECQHRRRFDRRRVDSVARQAMSGSMQGFVCSA
eukprot:365860-Chlamydomonas_euryale.AAC.7